MSFWKALIPFNRGANCFEPSHRSDRCEMCSCNQKISCTRTMGVDGNAKIFIVEHSGWRQITPLTKLGELGLNFIYLSLTKWFDCTLGYVHMGQVKIRPCLAKNTKYNWLKSYSSSFLSHSDNRQPFFTKFAYVQLFSVSRASPAYSMDLLSQFYQ